MSSSITVPEAALQLIARDAEGSMRDAQSKLDQVIAFTGNNITVEDVGTVLGLVGRDLLLDTVQAVADEDAAAAFVLTGRAVELGYDLRAVCRELTRVVRDLLIVSVDSTRINDPEIAAESERDRVKLLAARFSREDLLRAFDVLTRTEVDLRTAAQPRYTLEMALLRWIYLRKLTPIADLLAAASSTAPVSRSRDASGTNDTAASASTCSGSGERRSPLAKSNAGGEAQLRLPSERPPMDETSARVPVPAAAGATSRTLSLRKSARIKSFSTRRWSRKRSGSTSPATRSRLRFHRRRKRSA